MQVERVILTNFRNYDEAQVTLSPGRNILIGENAQGKTNFLEAIEFIATGKAERSEQDLDLIRHGTNNMRLEVAFEFAGSRENIVIGMQRNTAFDARQPARGANKIVEKSFKINGLSQSSVKAIKRRLVAVSFKSTDLNLVRGGPKFRRDWIDTMLSVLRPMHEDNLHKYAKVVTQRNRLLKQLFEKGKVSGSDNDQLRVWDMQLANLASHIIKARLTLISELLPVAEEFQEHISGRRESLSVRYLFKSSEVKESSDSFSVYNEDYDDDFDSASSSDNSSSVHKALGDLNNVSVDDLNKATEAEIARLIIQGLKSMRFDEIRRKQTLLGPHRDDIQLTINGQNAVYFGSQGQQRTLVLSLKLSELKRMTESLQEPPILLLDDVLAELDLNRQGLLMSAVGDSMQTIITTTHVTGFRDEWLAGAHFLSVEGGQVTISETAPS